MMGARGGAGDDPFNSLLALVRDAKATEARIVQLQSETKAHTEALTALRAKEAELGTREQELDKRTKEEFAREKHEMEELAARLYERENKLDGREAKLKQREAKLDKDTDSLKSQTVEQQDYALQRQQELDATLNGLEKREQALALREQEADRFAAENTEHRTKLGSLERDLLKRQSVLDKKLDAVKALAG